MAIDLDTYYRERDEWQAESDKLALWRKMQRTHCCAQCGAELVIAWLGHGMGGYILACGRDKSHQGHVKKTAPIIKTLESIAEASPEQRGAAEQAMEIYENERGEHRTMTEATPAQQATLAQYQHRADLVRTEVTEIIQTLWPKAPAPEVKKAILLCMQYRLNPLAKHIYLISYQHREEGQVVRTDWSIIWGIGATRLIARRAARKHGISYGYLDFSPRAMTEKEQEKVNGKVDNSKFWALTILRDSAGNEVYGIGNWPKTNAEGKPIKVKGEDKGNSPENMARIRSERNALDKLFPGEMVGEEIEIMDEAYLPEPIPQIKADATTGEIIETEAEEIPTDEPDTRPAKVEAKPVATSVLKPQTPAKPLSDLQAKEIHRLTKDWPTEKLKARLDPYKVDKIEGLNILQAGLLYNDLLVEQKKVEK